jgi:hypothetical protein
MLLVKLKPNAIVPWVSQIRQSIDHPQAEKNGGIYSKRDAQITFLDLVQGRSADGCALCQDRHWDPTTPACISNIVPKLGHAPNHRNGRG